MSYSIVGEQIQKYRKELGLTQRELGEALNVSSSAVSQWESGGTPDITLLPAIAEKLRVSIDALFGRDCGEALDMEKLAAGWIRGIPEEKRFDEICRLSFTLLKFGCFLAIDPPDMNYMKTAVMPDSDGTPMLLPSISVTDHGIADGVFAQDIAFASFFPEPSEGYAAYFASNDDYRELFKVLAEPDTLEIILTLATIRGWKCYTVGAVAKRAGVSEQRAKEVLDKLVKLHMATHLDLESDNEEINAYNLTKQFHLVPFLYYARLLRDPEGCFIRWEVRDKPLLKQSGK